MADPVALSNIEANVLPRTISAPIFNRSVESSAVMRNARKVPLTMTGNTMVPVSMDVPLADWVAEGGRKHVSTGSVGIRQMQGKKVAVLVPVSQEVAMTNAAGLYDQLQQDLPTALSRAFDFAAIHGKKITNGAAGPFEHFLTETDKEVALGTRPQDEGGIWADIVDGEALIADDNWDFSAFAADPRLKPQLKLSVDKNGRPIFVEDLTTASVESGLPSVNNMGSLSGYPVAFNRGVGGKLNRQSTTTDQGLRAIGGDWSQAAYGIGMDITIRISTEATYIDADGDAHSAFQDNLVLLLAEAYYGFVVGDPTAFVKYTTTPVGS